MKIDVDKLEGIALDYAVTKVCNPWALEDGVNHWRERRNSVAERGEYIHRYGQSWAQAGPLIFQHGISLIMKHDGWCRACVFNVNDDPQCIVFSTNPTVAAMRCLVWYQLGREVDIPEELL